jgi:hypothetical protein
MVIASEPFDVGARLSPGGVSHAAGCFSEMGGVVVEVGEASFAEFDSIMEKHGVHRIEIGRTQAAPALDVDLAPGAIRVSGADLRDARRGRVAEILYG